MKDQPKTIPLPPLVILIISGIFFYFSWFVSDAVRAAKLDTFILYNTDEIFRFYFVRLSLQSASVFVNSYVRPLYMVVASIFYNLLPLGMLSLRVMNVFFSCGTLYMVWRLARKIGLEDKASTLIILIIATNPIYFLHSISIHAANLFCFLLITSLYFFYCRKYLLSVLLSSLLPLVRPEGYLSLFLMVIFLWREKKQDIRYFLLLFLPLIVWLGMNRLMLGGGFLGRFFYQSLMQSSNVYGQNPLKVFSLRSPGLVITPLEFLLSSGYPIFVLFLIGLAVKLFDKKYLVLLSCFVAYFIFYSASTIIANFGLEKINIHGLMAIVSTPIIPFVAILAVIPLVMLNKNRTMGRLALIFFAAIFIASNLLQIVSFRQNPNLRWRILYTSTEQKVLKQAAEWLGKYAQKNNIKRLYISVDDAVHNFTNSFLLYLPTGIRFYMVSVQGDNVFLLDLETVKTLPFQEADSVYLTGDKNIANLNSNTKCRLVKGFDSVSLYFYSLEESK